MKLDIVNSKNTIVGQKELPSQFYEPIREDIIEKAVRVYELSGRQPHGAKPDAGKRASAKLSRRRHNYRGSYGFGISRVPRKILSRRGTRMNWVGAFAPGTVGGRQAHPPKSGKDLELKINKKEFRKAIRSAMSASLNRNLVQVRGHLIPSSFPFILQDSVQSLSKTKEVHDMLVKLGFSKELGRLDKSIRAGKGKMRGRKYKQPLGPLFVVGDDCPLVKSAGNISGVEVSDVKSLNIRMLAPGAMPGRLALFTESAIDTLSSTGFFTKEYAGQKNVKEKTVQSSKKMKKEKEAKEGTVMKGVKPGKGSKVKSQAKTSAKDMDKAKFVAPEKRTAQEDAGVDKIAVEKAAKDILMKGTARKAGSKKN
ncbi:50S ribosomal protein L4 [Candidatus Woesearchaeota archaeon]|nr:50S ribosomal protein L4 [Candidatus Woesearchaeota archaeon]